MINRWILILLIACLALVVKCAENHRDIICENGSLIDGQCICTGKYSGEHCDRLMHCESNDRDQSGRCLGCAEGWTGDKCTEIQCKNGQPKNRIQRCICDKPYSGDHCDTLRPGDVYSYYNHKVLSIGPVGVLIVFPLLLLKFSCERTARLRRIRRVEKHYSDLDIPVTKSIVERLLNQKLPLRAMQTPLLNMNRSNSPLVMKMSMRNAQTLHDVAQEADKIMSPQFLDAIWLDRAHAVLKNNKNPLTETVYKSYVLVLNGLICHHLKLSFGATNFTKIFNLIRELDSLIAECMKLSFEQSMDHFQAYAKSILVHRIGDLLFIESCMNNREEINNNDLIFASYMIAFDILHKMSATTQNLAVAQMFELFTLRALLKQLDQKKIGRTSVSKQIGQRLFEKVGGQNNANSYLYTIEPVPCSYEITNPNHKIDKIIAFSSDMNFLSRLLWLLAFDQDVRNLDFMASLLKNIPNDSNDVDFNSFTEQSFSRLDIEVLLISAAEWTRLSWYKNANRGLREAGICPQIVFARPSYMMIKLWKHITANVTNDNGERKMSTVVIAALEASRLRGEVGDIRIMGAVLNWLVSTKYNLKWADHYAQVVRDKIRGVIFANQNVFACDSFFPPIGDDIMADLEESLYRDARNYLRSCGKDDSSVSPNTSYNYEQVGNVSNGHDSGGTVNAPASVCDDVSNVLKLSPMKSSMKIKSRLPQRLECAARDYLRRDGRKLPFISASQSKIYSIESIKRLNKEREERKDRIHASTSDVSSKIVTDFDPVAYAMRLQKQYAEEFDDMKKMHDSAMANQTKQHSAALSAAYKQGYVDGFSHASCESRVQHVHLSPHDPIDCLGCKSENGVLKNLRKTDVCMTIFNFYLFNRDGCCIMYKEWKREKQSQMSKDEEFKLMYGMLLSLRSFSSKLSTKAGQQQVKCFQTNQYRLNYLEMPSGLKMVLNTDPNANGIQELMRAIYQVYVDAIVRNPLLDVNTQCTSDLFTTRVEQLIETHSAF